MRERITLLLEKLDIKQKEFAKEVNISQSNLSDLLNGRIKSFTTETIINIYKKYNVNPRWLLTGEGDIFLNEKGIDYSSITTIDDIKKTAWFQALSPYKQQLITIINELEYNITECTEYAMASLVLKKEVNYCVALLYTFTERNTVRAFATIS